MREDVLEVGARQCLPARLELHVEEPLLVVLRFWLRSGDRPAITGARVSRRSRSTGRCTGRRRGGCVADDDPRRSSSSSRLRGSRLRARGSTFRVGGCAAGSRDEHRSARECGADLGPRRGVVGRGAGRRGRDERVDGEREAARSGKLGDPWRRRRPFGERDAAEHVDEQRRPQGRLILRRSRRLGSRRRSGGGKDCGEQRHDLLQERAVVVRRQLEDRGVDAAGVELAPRGRVGHGVLRSSVAAERSGGG
mmetsp:Transcript_1827/g.7061  ORF Transcript_1827/g.7061 Transcript_1827/m.7061 type:complete len:251 (-) Transcript_1827:910-1662(-)